ncbi:MAG: magnesium chelatase subunit H [Lautropia sp.]
MKPRHTSVADPAPLRIAIVTLDNHLASTVDAVRRTLRNELGGLELSMHAASQWADDPASLARCLDDIGRADLIFVSMLFMEEHIQPVLPALAARRMHCDALVVCMSAPEVARLTRMGRFSTDRADTGTLAMLKRLRGKSTGDAKAGGATAGARQMQVLRRLPKILRFIPGTAQDVRAYLLAMQYWLAGSQQNIANLLRMLVERYAGGDRLALREKVRAAPPVEYPEIGVYHPELRERMRADVAGYPRAGGRDAPTVGLLLMRSYLLAGNTEHYDGVIAAFEARGMNVVCAFACGLDARPAIERFYLDADGRCTIDALVSLTGFSLVGGPAYNDAEAGSALLAMLDVPYLAALPLEFQTLEQWQASRAGLLPVEATMMVAIPELDGATGPIVFGGRSDAAADGSRDMRSHRERAAMLAARAQRLIALRRKARAERRIAIVLFAFPPNGGNLGTAAFLSVFASLYNTLCAMQRDGYSVDLPESVDALRARIIDGNAQRFGAIANVEARIDVDEHVREQPWLAEIEAQWGPAPGAHQSDGRSIHVLGATFGNVFVGIQPGFGLEGDPMRMLFEGNFAPTHAFCAFYRFIRGRFGADAVLHFGTHGALEFMPGKQAGLSGDCWPDRLIGDLPNLYLYASNNPSEGAIARRRSAATLISYLTPSLTRSGLYRGLTDLKESIGQWRCQAGAAPDAAAPDRQAGPAAVPTDRAAGAATRDLLSLIHAQASALDMAAVAGTSLEAWIADPHAPAVAACIDALALALLELEQSLIPHGLHVVGAAPSIAERVELLCAIDEAGDDGVVAGARAIEALVRTGSQADALAAFESSDTDGGADAARPDVQAVTRALERLADIDRRRCASGEIDGILRGLDGRFIVPAPGGDLLHNPQVLPTGRNLHGFDPYRIPTAWAMQSGQRQAERLLARYRDDGHPLPESIALVLWGTDNLKSGGTPIGQALALLGARARFDHYGRLAGAELVPLAVLKRPRIDIVVTLSGIFRDLLPIQTRLLAEACLLAASAEDEPLDMNHVRRHALQYQRAHGCDLETASLRVFSNADGAYGSNVNLLVDSGAWADESELADTYAARKSFAYGRTGKASAQPALLRAALADVSLAYQNLESVELGVTTVDHYFDTLGGISRLARRERGDDLPVYIGDQTHGHDAVRTLGEQVALEARTRMLNPKWYEGMIEHGYEGVRQIEAHVTNTMGWSATTGQVAPWVYQQISDVYMLDQAMRERLAALNPAASVRVAQRLLEAHERHYWNPDAQVLDALRRAGEALEDRLEGITMAETA